MRRTESINELDDVVGVDIDGDLLDVSSRCSRLTAELRTNIDADLTAGDLDPDCEIEELLGDNSGRHSDRDIVDELGEAIGLTYEEDEELWCGTKERERDRHRWELDPASADDWRERKRR